ncbi:transcriptional regulatory protein WalR [bacterium BMS3Abin07]|nr:transcriptional regulatory protein WalR [bacterium BMS3Abin07]GBE32750.1 transcriptional regulatory protein WalR [bacterium BMS3Bbin05]HDO22039.1 response regulator transcription factor [Nitrospirota bacterium]HDZ88980.1 response regulator transcription factor [Nitrospirota bacterium]
MNTKPEIIVVDDEKDLLQLLKYNLEKDGYSVTGSYNGEDALKNIKRKNFDLIILDLMLPGIQGMDLCRILKENEKTSHIPIIMLTAKSDELDKVLGLELGADDYITKPFSPRELIARVKTVLRRTRRVPKTKKTITIGDLEINTETYQVAKKKNVLKLSATEFKLLLYLVERKGRVFNRDMLLDAVWKDEAFVEPRTVDVHVRRLRMQIEDDPSHPVYLKTRRGIGYYIDGDL